MKQLFNKQKSFFMELIFKFYDGLGKMDYVWNIEEKLTYQSRNLKLTSVTPFYLFFQENTAPAVL